MPKVIFDWDLRYKKGIIISDFFDVIREHFSIANENANFLRKRLGPMAHIPLRKYAITESGRFEAGLFFDIYKYLNATYPLVEIEITGLLKQNLLFNFEFKKENIPELSLPLRYYQERSIMRSVKFGRGTIVVGTGGGKTLLMASLIKTMKNHLSKDKVTFIILLPQLLEQTYEDFISYGISKNEMSQWGGDHDFEKKPIILASVKTIESKLVSFKSLKPKIPKEITVDEKRNILENYKIKEKQRLKEWTSQKRLFQKIVDQTDLLLVDEVHSLRKENVFNKIIDLFDTPHRFGFTGTLPESNLDKWNIIGRIGPIIEDIPSDTLRKEGYLSQVHTTVLQISYKDSPIHNMNANESLRQAYEEECNFIFTNEYRNNIITHISKTVDKNLLILVNSLEHGKTLFDKISSVIPEKRVYYVRGEVPIEEREKIRKIMEKENNVVCIAISKVFSVGINITNLHFILFALTGKAKIRLIQSIGRGLRLHETKDMLEIFDIADNLPYCNLHFEKRKKHYEQEKIPFTIKRLCQ